MKVELSAAAKDAVRNVLPLVDANKWSKVYNQLYEWAYKDIQHPLKAFETGQITKFFEQNCGFNILSETKIIPTSVQCIEDEVFHGCNDLEYITYEGTMEQWKLINKGYRFWTRGRTFDPMTVKCSDGDIER